MPCATRASESSRPASTITTFSYLDRQAPGPDFSITVPFRIRPQPAVSTSNQAEVRGDRITFAKTLTAGEDRVYMDIEGFGADPKDYDIRIENRRLGAGVRITRRTGPFREWPCGRSGRRSRLNPSSTWRSSGAEFTWRIVYEFYTFPKESA